jgi:hypothetical protein
MAMPLLNRITGQIIRLGARALAAGQIKITAVGLEHIPENGPVLLVARHYHHLFDGVCTAAFDSPSPSYPVTLDWRKKDRFDV